MVMFVDFPQCNEIISQFIFLQVQNDTLKEGQFNITQSTYDDIVLQQLSELWTNYGQLEEIWFDGG